MRLCGHARKGTDDRTHGHFVTIRQRVLPAMGQSPGRKSGAKLTSANARPEFRAFDCYRYTQLP
jgi:hypothetical protein